MKERTFSAAEFSRIGGPNFEARLRELRFRLHRRPELSMREYDTTQLLRAYLTELGLELVELGLDTGAAALLKGGRPGPTVALRADIDALPIREETGTPDASMQPGVMHACGHDVHTAALVGAAELLVRQREDLQGNILFLFQPAEEMADGAEAVIRGGLFQRIPVNAMFAFHVWPHLPLGYLGLRAGALMSAKDSFQIVVRGRGGHGCAPQCARNPISAGSALITTLESIVGQNLPPQEQAALSVCSVHAGSCDNVIPDNFVIQGSIRTFSAETRKVILTHMEEMSRAVAAAYGCLAECLFQTSAPVLTNDARLVRIMGEVGAELFGAEACPAPERAMISEDFACYGAICPICFALLGVGSSDGGTQPLHSPRFYPDGQALAPAAALLARTAYRFLVQTAR